MHWKTVFDCYYCMNSTIYVKYGTIFCCLLSAVLNCSRPEQVYLRCQICALTTHELLILGFVLV